MPVRGELILMRGGEDEWFFKRAANELNADWQPG